MSEREENIRCTAESKKEALEYQTLAAHIPFSDLIQFPRLEVLS